MRARVLWVVALVLLVVTVFLQQAGVKTPPAPGPEPLTPPRFDSVTLLSRLALYFRESGMVGQKLSGDLLDAAPRQRDRVRVAIVLNELDRRARPGTAILQTAQAQLEPQSAAGGPAAELLADVMALLEIYRAGTADGVSPAARAALLDHHGWFGGLALSVGLADTHPERVKYLGFASWPFVAVGVMLVFGAIAFITGIVLCIYFVQRRRSGLLPSRIGRPLPGSLGVEMLVVFIAAFLAVKAIASQMGSPAAVLILQWAILPVVLQYPRLRAGDRSGAREFLGMHRGRGLLAEAGAGAIGWMACLPLLAAGAVASAALMALWDMLKSGGGGGGAASGGGAGGPAPTNPVMDLLVGLDSPALIAMLAALAVVWAPLVEETVFRGAVLPHLRARTGFIVAAVASALAFALMHGYAILMLGPVLMLGVGFAMIRAARGSLVASMTAHAIHNGLVLLFLGLVMRGLMPPTP